MAKRYLNYDEDKPNLTDEAERFKQRVMRGINRPLLSLAYNPERGTRNSEMVDKPLNRAISNILLYSRKYLRNYYPEVSQKVVKVKTIDPLVISFEIDILEDTTP